jgi:hypothetical protein
MKKRNGWSALKTTAFGAWWVGDGGEVGLVPVEGQRHPELRQSVAERQRCL